jgi:hypothetical protein
MTQTDSNGRESSELGLGTLEQRAATSMPRLSTMAFDESVALELRIAAETLFDGETVAPTKVLSGLLSEPGTPRPVVRTVVGLLARLLVRQGRGHGDTDRTARDTAEVVMGDVWNCDSTRGRELLAIVLRDGVTTPEERAATQGHSAEDLMVLSQLTMGLAAVVGASEGRTVREVLDEVVDWPSVS